jgi:hypothetical protein
MTPVNDIRSEARGPHGVITRGSTKARAVSPVVGATQADAEAGAKEWAESQG